MKKFIAILFCVLMCVVMMFTTAEAKDIDFYNRSGVKQKKTLECYESLIYNYYFKVPYTGNLIIKGKFSDDNHYSNSTNYGCYMHISSGIIKENYAGISYLDNEKLVYGNGLDEFLSVNKSSWSKKSFKLEKGEYRLTIDPTDAGSVYITYEFECAHENKSSTIIEPTCQTAGTETISCKDCGETFDETIKKLDHDTDRNWTVIQEATCAQEGKSVKYCSMCQQEAEVKTFDKLAHKFSKWEITVEPTCTAPGEVHRICSSCNLEEKKEATQLDHEFSKWEKVKDSTCSEVGQKKRICSVCKLEETEEIEKKDHHFSRWETVTESTCSNAGSKKRVCSVCNFEEKEDIKPLAHKFLKWEVITKSTCTTLGERTHTCTVCNFTEKETIEKSKHDYGNWTVTKKATCTSEGSRYHVCEVCNYKETQTTNETPHNFDDWYVTYQATERSEGSRRHTCSKCGKTETETIPQLVCGKKTYSKTTQKATCTQQGKEQILCQYCNKVISEKTLRATGHNVSRWSVTTAATYDKDGVKSGTCSYCNTTVKEEYKFERPGRDGFKSGRKYDNRFNDVKKENWFFDYVTKAYEYSLANGMSNVEFSPNSTFTVAQALTVATNIHSAYYGDKPDAVKNGEKWYMPNVRYCIEHKIITEKQFDNYDRNITRGEMAQVFANILPEEEYKAVRNGRPNDMTTDIPSFNAVKKLYDAGIVSGDAETSNFRPNDNIKRSEACVIFTCIALPEYRKGTSEQKAA